MMKDEDFENENKLCAGYLLSYQTLKYWNTITFLRITYLQKNAVLVSQKIF